MIEIPDKPDRPVCSQHGPLKWFYGDTRQGPRWVAFTLEEGGLLAPHVCQNPDAPAARWQPNPIVAERNVRHASAIRERMGWPTGEQKIIEETDG